MIKRYPNMSLEFIDKMLKEITGVDSSARGESMLKRAVSERMRVENIANIHEYKDCLVHSAREQQSLIDELMVTETWFFRDQVPFDTLAEYVGREWLSNKSFRTVNILSVPCATGEEPYSIAMSLLKCGLRRDQFSIDAVDISTRALRHAKRGVYGKHSFRNEDMDRELKKSFFNKRKNGYAVKDVVKNTVNFHHVNFWDDNFPKKHYDIIFCRNLLIYFDKESQAAAVEKLVARLAMGGVFLVGHAETLCVKNDGLRVFGGSGSYAYVKKPPRLVAEPEPEPVRRVELPEPQPQLKADKPAWLQQHVDASDRSGLTEEQSQRYLLEQAQRFIDEDNVLEAAVLCRKHIKRFPSSAQAYYLYGICFERDGFPQMADRLYHQAIQYEPDHYQALMRLAKSLEQQGDVIRANRYKERALRLLGVAPAGI